jgi:hypothetical protein
VHRLQVGKDPECLLAQKIFEQGHYAGRTQPSNTRQGIYAAAPSGFMLASINTNDPIAMAGMLRRALDKWNAMTPFERSSSVDVEAQAKQINRPEAKYPEDGLVLRVFSRDLPRENLPKDWRGSAWNQDYAWFRRDEVLSMMPAKMAKGAQQAVPAPILNRLVRLNFVDNVRGQTPAFAEKDIVRADLTIEVVSVNGGVADVVLRGSSRVEAAGRWAVAGYRDMNSPSEQKAYIDLKLFGRAKYRVETERFTSFEMVALGTRYGATQYNGRTDDAGPAPIGYALVKAGNTSAERVAPANYWNYHWR